MRELIAECEGFEIVNAAGYSTRVGGSCPNREVLEAMAYAQSQYFEIDDLLDIASRIIAEATGSEAGLVTCGAGAALALSAAAVLVRNDVEKMDQLPDVSSLQRKEFIYPTCGRFNYDHPLRSSGATLRQLPFSPDTLEQELAEAISPATAGVVFVWKHRTDDALIKRISTICRERQIPFIVDAAMALPPSENLRALYALGPNLITISGGKHLGGPQNSGLLFGDHDLIHSAWLQMVDMDVRPASWSRRPLLNEGFVSRPPRHGLGRAMKIGKDTILGCLAAVKLYGQRDLTAERARWHSICQTIVHESTPSAHFQLQYLEENGTGQYPVVKLLADSAERMNRLKDKLKSLPRKVILAEHEEDEAVAYIYPLCLSDQDLGIVIGALSKLTYE